MATEWIIRTNSRKVAYLTNPKEHHDKVRLLESDAKLVSRTKEHHQSRTANKILSSLDDNTEINPCEAGKVIKAAWEIKATNENADIWGFDQDNRRRVIRPLQRPFLI